MPTFEENDEQIAQGNAQRAADEKAFIASLGGEERARQLREGNPVAYWAGFYQYSGQNQAPSGLNLEDLSLDALRFLNSLQIYRGKDSAGNPVEGIFSQEGLVPLQTWINYLGSQQGKDWLSAQPWSWREAMTKKQLYFSIPGKQFGEPQTDIYEFPNLPLLQRGKGWLTPSVEYPYGTWMPGYEPMEAKERTYTQSEVNQILQQWQRQQERLAQQKQPQQKRPQPTIPGTARFAPPTRWLLY